MNRHGSSKAIEYTTKLVEPGAFRLIILHPSAKLRDPLHASLIKCNLSSYDNDIVDHYIALSYVWGSKELKSNITLDSQTLRITASLESALQHLCDATRPLKILADGICIDQKDHEEKSEQVQ